MIGTFETPGTPELLFETVFFLMPPITTISPSATNNLVLISIVLIPILPAFCLLGESLLTLTSKSTFPSPIILGVTVNDNATSLNLTSADFTFNSPSNGEQLARFTANDSCEFYFNGNKKVETDTSGIGVTGNITVSGTVDGRDVATDGTKLDGIEASATADQTASEIVSLLSDQNIATTGTISTGSGSDQLNITHSGGGASHVAATGDLVLKGTDNVYIGGVNNETHIKCTENGSVELFHDNVKKAQTYSSGFDVTGNITVSGTVDGKDIALSLIHI